MYEHFLEIFIDWIRCALKIHKPNLSNGFSPPSSVENVLKTLVKSCRPYFPADATAEMLEEWRPLMCPFDVTMQKAITYFEIFLPTSLPPQLHHKGFKLWFDELIGLWVSVQNLPQWEGQLVNLFARLATDNIGYIDWDPYVPKIFTRILRSLNLPVGSSQVLVPRFLTNAYDIGHAVIWITAMMVCNTLVHLNFVLTIQKFCIITLGYISILVGHLILGYFLM